MIFYAPQNLAQPASLYMYREGATTDYAIKVVGIDNEGKKQEKVVYTIPGDTPEDRKIWVERHVQAMNTAMMDFGMPFMEMPAHNPKSFSDFNSILSATQWAVREMLTNGSIPHRQASFYRHSMAFLAAFYRSQNLTQLSSKELTADHLRSVQSAIDLEPVTGNTRRMYAQRINKIWAFMADNLEGFPRFSILQTWFSTETRVEHAFSLTDSTIKTLFEEMKRQKMHALRLLCNIMYYAPALSVPDVLEIRIKDVDLDAGKLWIGYLNTHIDIAPELLQLLKELDIVAYEEDELLISTPKNIGGYTKGSRYTFQINHQNVKIALGWQDKRIAYTSYKYSGILRLVRKGMTEIEIMQTMKFTRIQNVRKMIKAAQAAEIA